MTDSRTTWGLMRYFLYLGSLGFGGPVALIGYMQRDLVERQRWFGKDDYDRFSGNAQVKTFVGGVTAAAAGAIAGACFVLGRRAIVDVPTALLALGAFALLWRFKVPEPVLIAGAGVAGVLILRLKGAP
jgi:chromate transport protein ChrA